MKWNNWNRIIGIKEKTDKHLLRGVGKWRRRKNIKISLFFPLSEGVASPFNQLFFILLSFDCFSIKARRKCCQSVRWNTVLGFRTRSKTNININHRQRTKHKRNRLWQLNPARSLFIGLMWCKTGKIQPSQDVKFK